MKALFAFVILSIGISARGADRSFPEKVRDAAERVGDKTRDAALDARDAIVGAARRGDREARAGWAKTKAFFSDDLPVYREGAQATLAGLGREIADLRARTPTGAPEYFRTRLAALFQQHEWLTLRLARVSSETLRERQFGPRFDFDRCVADLERALDQAEDGADLLVDSVRR